MVQCLCNCIIPHRVSAVRVSMYVVLWTAVIVIVNAESHLGSGPSSYSQAMSMCRIVMAVAVVCNFGDCLNKNTDTAPQ